MEKIKIEDNNQKFQFDMNYQISNNPNLNISSKRQKLDFLPVNLYFKPRFLMNPNYKLKLFVIGRQSQFLFKNKTTSSLLKGDNLNLCYLKISSISLKIEDDTNLIANGSFGFCLLTEKNPLIYKLQIYIMSTNISLFKVEM